MLALYYNGIYIIIACAIAIWFLPDQWARRSALIVAFILAVLFINALDLIPFLLTQPHGHWLSSTWQYMPNIGLNIQYRIAGLGLLFYILITGIGCLVFTFAYFYMQGYTKLGSFFAYLTLFAGAMLGIISANNLLLLLVYWELTTVTSYLLIGYKHSQLSARNAALQGLLTTILGGLALVAACALIFAQTHTLNIYKLLSSPEMLTNSPYFSLITILIVIGAVTKSAQFPFHYWLPGAMEAPTPVSTYLHSATMVNAGIYLLALLHPILSTLSWWYPTLSTIGLLTMLTGGWMALRSYDIKMILAYTTIYALGSMVYLLASNKVLALEALVVFIVIHALYKAALFMLAGFLEKTYQTRDINQIHGLWRASPIASLLLIINCASMASLPPFFGFFAKQIILEAKLASPDLKLLLEIISFSASGLIALQGLRLIIQMLPQRRPNLPKPQTVLILPSLILTLITISFTILPYAWDKLRLSHLAIQSMTVFTHQTTWLSLQEYTSLSTALCAIISLLGFVFWVFFNPLSKLAVWSSFLDNIMPEALYNHFLWGLNKTGNWIEKRVQNGNLHNYLASLWVFFTFLIMTGLLFNPPDFSSLALPSYLSPADVVLACFTLGSAIMAIILRTPITILASLSIFGFVMAIIFLIHGAPDVAITQILVDTLIVILFVIILHRLPTLKIKNQITLNERLLSIIIATLAGISIGVILFLVTQHPISDTLSTFYIQNSLPKAHGRNIVNVILVDFRALDTLGEIIVVTAAAIGILGLISKHGERSS